MIMNKFIKFILIFFLIFSINPLFAKRKNVELKLVSDSEFIELAKKNISAKKYSIYKSRIGRFIFFSDKNDSGYFILTGDYFKPKGYKGPTSVGLVLSFDAKQIKNCILIESTDTKSYIEKFFIKGVKENENIFFNQFFHKKITDDNKGKFIEVDSVSGATITSRAISKSINETLQIVLPMINTIIFENGEIKNDKFEIQKSDTN